MEDLIYHTLQVIPQPDGNVGLAVLEERHNEEGVSAHWKEFDEDAFEKDRYEWKNEWPDQAQTFLRLHWHTANKELLAMARNRTDFVCAMKYSYGEISFLYRIWQNAPIKTSPFANFAASFQRKPNACKRGSYRRRFGISKNKFLALTKFATAQTASLPNRCFDDDIELLLNCGSRDASLVMLCKEANPRLKYADILRKILEQRILTSKQGDSLSGFVQMHKDIVARTGIDFPFTLPQTREFSAYYSMQRGMQKSDLMLDGYVAVSIDSTSAMNYALAITDAFSVREMEIALLGSSRFYLAVNKKPKEMFMIEERCGTMIRMRRNRRDVIL